jgi:hypothetical protein
MMFKEIENEINSLPIGFFGTVEFTFQAGIPTFIRVTHAIKLDPTKVTRLDPKPIGLRTNGDNLSSR